MRKYIFLYFLLWIQTASAQLDNLYAFTHPKFFFSLQCECNRFDFDNIYLSLYDTNANFVLRTIIPANFDVGHQVIIMRKKGDFFKIKFCEGVPGDYEQDLIGEEFCVQAGDLGTWLYNYNKDTNLYIEVPLYEKPSLDSKTSAILDIGNSVAIILDISGNWMLIETIGRGGGQRGWLSSQNQCGNPYGVYNGICY